MKVLLPIDGSDSCKKTLEWVSHFLIKNRDEISLLHVIYLAPEAFISDSEIEAGIKMLEEAKLMLLERGFIVTATEYVIGTPSEAICDYADENQIDQIIIGSHGRQGVAKFLLGSVSEAVFKHAKQPVLVVKNDSNASIQLSHIDKLRLSGV